MKTTILRCLSLALLICSNGQVQSVFFIEAEDFDYGRGQHPPETDAMPYYGAAFFNYFDTVAERGIDFDRSDFLHFIEDYRYGEYPNYSAELFPSSGIQQFLIESGETVDQNFHGKWTKGAGYLTPNGAEDIFTFQLKADSVVTLVDLGSEFHGEAELGV